MNHLKFYLFIGCLSALVYEMHSQTKIAGGFIFPMKIDVVSSGSFGEIRPNHFHSGLDLATNQKTGYKVYAVADGFVSRIKVSAVGYGRAIYIQHPNGFTSVYGHLEEYDHLIDSFVVEKQYAARSFEIDLFPDPEDIPVKSGQLIGYSGNSGNSGGPHLHFEIRYTSSQKPANPLFFYDNIVKDDVKPVIMGIRTYSLTGRGAVKSAGYYQKAVLVEGVYRLQNNQPVYASGITGIGIEVVDHHTNSWRKCGVHSITLEMDGEPVFQSEIGQFDFADTRFVNSHIDYSYKVNHGNVLQKSFIDPNNRLDIYKIRKNNGYLTIEPGKSYPMQYVVVDANGNKSVMKFTIKGSQPGSSNGQKIEKWQAWDEPFVFQQGIFRVDIPEKTFYSDVKLNVTIKKSTSGLINDQIEVGNADIPVHSPYTIEMKVPDPFKKVENRLCIVRFGKDGKPTYAGGSSHNGWIVTKTRDMGIFTLGIDTIKPVIAWLNAAPSFNYKGRKKLEINMKDNFSGIDQFHCLVDDKWTLFEYDAKTNRLICPLDKAKLKTNSKHVLKITVRDGCGNEQNKVLSFFY